MEQRSPAGTLLHSPWMRDTRVIVSGLFLAAIAGFYILFVGPLANVAVVSDYRFPFSFAANIYTIFVMVYAAHFVYRLARPRVAAIGEAPKQISVSQGIGMVLRTAFLLTVGGSYLSGAMISTPEVFQNVLPSVTGTGVVFFAQTAHSIFATLLVTLGILIILNEVVRVTRKEQTVKEWLFSARYPEIKVLYWAIAILVVVQGILGLLLLGTPTPVGPFALIGQNVYGFEDLVRHIHGPMAAVLISIFYGHVYLRIRPEYSIH